MLSSFKVENLQLLHYNKGQIPDVTSSSAQGKAITHPKGALHWLLGISQYFDIYSFSCQFSTLWRYPNRDPLLEATLLPLLQARAWTSDVSVNSLTTTYGLIAIDEECTFKSYIALHQHHHLLFFIFWPWSNHTWFEFWQKYFEISFNWNCCHS